MSGALPFAPPATTAAIERRLNWRAVPLAVFVLLLALLAAIAMVQLRAPHVPLQGLPDTQEIRIARGLAHGRLLETAGPWRFYSSLLGDGAMFPTTTAETREAARQVGDLLLAAPAWARSDPRFPSATASLALLGGRHREAERLYRSVADRAPGYGEAQLGVGVALALRASKADSPRYRRSLQLAALAHLLAVAPEDPAYPAALYDRVMLLRAVGRHDDARRSAELYRLNDPSSAWALNLETTTAE